MHFIIVFILPSILGLKLFMHFNKNKKILDLGITFLLLLVLSNFISMIITHICNKQITDLVAYANAYLSFAIKYMSVMLVCNIVLSILLTIIDKYLVFDIEVENERKAKKRKTIKQN